MVQRRNICIIVVCFLLTTLYCVGGETDYQVLVWTEPTSCSKYQYFDAVLFKCRKCPDDLVSSGDRLGCVCSKNSRIIDTRAGSLLCELCDKGKILTSDGSACIECRKAAESCDCAANEIRIERNSNGTFLDALRCLPCPESTYSTSDHTRCLPCVISTSKGDENRATSDSSDESRDRLYKYCLPRNAPPDWPDVRNTYLNKFKASSIDSYYFRTEMRFTVHSCEKGDQRSCEHLANMCVLTLFIDSTVCKLFIRKNDNLGKLFYRESNPRTILNRRTITQRYTLDQTDPNSKIKLIIAAFTLRGELVRIGAPSLSCPFFHNIRFGVNLRKTCKISAIELLNEKMEFLVPYLAYTEKNNDKRHLHPLPVLFKNNENNIDENDITRWRLVHRFFTVDTITGYKAIPNLGNASFTRAPNLEVLRYIKSLNLLVKVQERNERGKIFPPLLVVEYDELTKDEITENVEVSVEYKVTYSLADDEITNAVEVCIGVFTGLAVAFAAIKAWSHSRRNNESFRNIATVCWFIVYSVGAIGNALLLVTSGTCIYTFIFYKGQKVVHILIPNRANESTITVCTIIAFAFKVVEMLGLIYQHRRVNIFFIDWEQPRRIDGTPLKYDSPRTSLRKSYTGRFALDAPNVMHSASEIIGARRKKTPSKSSAASTPSRQSASGILDLRDAEHPTAFSESNFSIGEHDVSQSYTVSIWRTCVIANEWLKLKTKRKINVLLQMLATLFILEIVGVKNWSIAVPELTLKQDEQLRVEESFTLQYAVGITVFALLYFVQWWLSVFVYEKYVKNELQEFIDLCSMANISAFVLSHDYYGYYIHGRSVHGFADTDLLTLINDLKREENNLCAHRGLIPGTTEQTFVMFVSKTFRTFYDSLLGPQNSSDRRFLRRSVSKIPDWSERWKIHLKLRKFLTSFLDHCFKNIDYTVKERHFIEKLCDIEIIDVYEKSVFYIDNNYSFDRTMFYGNEWTLATFEISVFVLVLVLEGNYIIASIVTVFVAKIVNAIARFDGKRILANKTLIDERFLVS